MLQFPVTIDRPARRSVIGSYVTCGGIGDRGCRRRPRVVTIPAGQTATTVEVPILGDNVHESPREEKLELRVTEVLRARIGAGVAVGTISRRKA